MSKETSLIQPLASICRVFLRVVNGRFQYVKELFSYLFLEQYLWLMTMKNRTRAELAVNIKKHRWLVFNVVGDADELFSYTVGLFETFGHPEVVLSGLNNDLALAILNDIGHDVAEGVVREAEVQYDDVLEGYPCLFKAVPTKVYEQYFGRALVFYEDTFFPVLQCLWPDALKRFPGDFGYTPSNQEALFE